MNHLEEALKILDNVKSEEDKIIQKVFDFLENDFDFGEKKDSIEKILRKYLKAKETSKEYSLDKGDEFILKGILINLNLENLLQEDSLSAIKKKLVKLSKKNNKVVQK